MTTTETTSTTIPNDRFQTRDELVQFIEQKTSDAIEKSRVDRRVPWATSGPVGRDSDGYSVLKAAAYALGYIGADQAKEEIHTHQQLRDLYSTYGFVPHCGAQSFLIPLSTNHLPAFESRGAKLRDEIRCKMTAQADKFDPDEARWLNRRLNLQTKSLGTITDTAGGTLVRYPVLGEIIDLQRNLEVFSMAGAQEIALPPNGRIQFPKLTGGSTAYWVGEATAITESQPTTGNLDLQAKKLGVLVKVNNELLRFASPSAEGLIRYDMARSVALKADLSMLEGNGSTQIKGLLTYGGITQHTASTLGTNGNTFEPQDVALMEGKLPDAVGAPTAWLMRKNMFAALMNRRADAVNANDGKGPFLFHPMRSAADAPPSEIYGTRVVRSSQVSTTRTKGSGSNLTYVLLGYFPDWVIARMGVMEFMASGLGDSALTNDQTYLRGIQHIDAGPRNISSFVLCDQLVAA
ncbi:phage major capsid protein [Telmatocola sphagniphila]|uniref:Phage major capsid protein n=1 Tax=Telmatocola sphagniphila TaxID=1123043 RepID=A0A8E6B5L3_9BACT|nr:phage major capsid protein [Telmatocola sphagniphila]QVL30933.1 phage major capsid protein [Telmatocola sphagniphila]